MKYIYIYILYGDPEDHGEKNCPHYRHHDGEGNTVFSETLLDFGNLMPN